MFSRMDQFNVGKSIDGGIMTYRIGLTGGIGSGKTTVAQLFSALRVPIIDADEIARHLTSDDLNVLAAIAAHFGPNILNPQGQLDRHRLREVIFQNLQEKHWLEAILHPLIFQEIKLKIAQLNAPYVIVVIPLLAETQSLSLVQRVLVVDSPEDLQIKRVTQRDGANAEMIARIIEQQASRSERLKLADDVISNDGSLTALQEAVQHLHQQYLQLASLTPPSAFF